MNMANPSTKLSRSLLRSVVGGAAFAFLLLTFGVGRAGAQSSTRTGACATRGCSPMASSIGAAEGGGPGTGGDDGDDRGTLELGVTYLIADQFNNRVVEMDDDGNVVWQYGTGSWVAGPGTVVGPNDAERVDWQLTLISGSGAPAGFEPNCVNGCPDNRVLLVTLDGQIFWQYGQAGVTGSGPNQLNTPVCAAMLPDSRDVLITDQGNQRVIQVDRKTNQIVWQYGTTGVAGSDFNELSNPNSAELLANGNILIADESNNRVIEVNRDNEIVWSYGSPSDTTTLSAPAFASRLVNGDTLIADSGNNRAVEVAADASTVVWTYVTSSRPGSVSAPTPTRAVRLQTGNTLISDQFNHQVIEVDPSGNIVLQLGQIGISGAGQNQLNAPYDAKVVGDFTGLTPPIWPNWN